MAGCVTPEIIYMSVTPEKKERFHFLDGLRGIASLMIVIHHSFTSNIVKLLAHVKLPVVGFYFAYFTQSGVELFFVLSGSVLLRPYLRGERKFKTGEYFIRRIKRIYFPYWAALLFAVFVSWYITAYPTWYNIKVYHMPVVWWEVLREAFIIDTMGCYYNLAWWSLGIELVFYLLVPLILFVLPSKYKPGNGQVALMLVITLLVSIGLQLWLTEYYPQIYSYKHMVATVY